MTYWDKERRTLIKQGGIVVGLGWLVFTISPFWACVLGPCGLILVFHHYLKRRDRALDAVVCYLQALERGDTHFDLGAYDEGGLNRLKSQLHKTMIPLNVSKHQMHEQKRFLKQALEDISHQLKTPITALQILNELQDGNDELVYRSSLQIERLAILTQDLLTLTKLDAGVVVFKKETIKAHQLIDRILEQYAPLITKKGLTIIVEDDGVEVSCDSLKTHEALSNVFHNKLDFAVNQIVFKTVNTGLNTQIIISDDGPTIPLGLREKVFERFYTGPHKRDSSVGIGLAIAREIMVQQEGNLVIEPDGSFLFNFLKS